MIEHEPTCCDWWLWSEDDQQDELLTMMRAGVR